MRIIIRCFLALLLFGPVQPGYSYERGTIFYHSSKNDEIYGRAPELELPCSVIQAVLGDLKSGHVGLYVGDGKIIHAVLEGVVETASENFVTQDDLDRGAKFMGGKVPVDYDDSTRWPDERKDQLIIIAREQVGKWYDLTFHKQIGSGSGDFTCVGLVEFVYEMAGYVITPMGYYQGGPGGESHIQTYNCLSTMFMDWRGENTFAREVRFSKFEHPLGFAAGRSHEGQKYMFFPYTQYLQASTVHVESDTSVVPVSSGSGSDGFGCFVATAAYGSGLNPHVTVLRKVRDRHLRTSDVGRIFLSAYAQWSPSVARAIVSSDFLRLVVRIMLLPVIAMGYMVYYVGPGLSACILLTALLLTIFIIRSRWRKVASPGIGYTVTGHNF